MKMKTSDFFTLPILHTSPVYQVDPSTVKNLELTTVNDDNKDTDKLALYHNVFDYDDGDKLATDMVNEFANHYTTNITFLNQTQQLVDNFKVDSNNKVFKQANNAHDIWKTITVNEHFLETYNYMEWKGLSFLNHSSEYLQATTMCTIFSPILSILSPILMAIIPFIMLRLHGITITVSSYISSFWLLIKSSSMGKILSTETTLMEKLFGLLSLGMYVFSLYQNVQSCIQFDVNMQQIHTYCYDLHEYCMNTIALMDQCIGNMATLSEYVNFSKNVEKQKTILYQMAIRLREVDKYEYTVTKARELGTIMKYFYELHTNDVYNECIMYSFGFVKYMQLITSVNANMSRATFITDPKTTQCIIKDSYYPATDCKITNSISLDKNKIITGPNASGKTTLLKSTFFNIILSQQIGYGFYSSAILCPYDGLCCYINIPDTSGRDSLFQAEAKRCSHIVDEIKASPTKRSFCIFDELFSGTNPTEASICSLEFMKHLSTFENVTWLLTTHFVDVCNTPIARCMNYKMLTHIKNDNIKYTYKMKRGISTAQSATLILSELFPNMFK